MTTDRRPDPVEVIIDTPGPTITVKAVAALDTVATKALDLYRETIKDWPPDRNLSGGSGFHSERSLE